MEETRKNPPSEQSSGFDATSSAKKWRARFDASRTKIGETAVVEDISKISGSIKDWPVYDHGHEEHTDASKLKRTLNGNSADATEVRFYDSLGNLLEQVDRQVIIGDALKEGLGGRRILGIVADGRLEAVCIWTILTATGTKKQEEDANWWDQGWKKALYIPELTGAPWNVGWPTVQSGVSGAGTALVKAMKEKAKAEGCDGIGLIGNRFNLGFYLHVGFQRKPGEGFITFIMDLRT